MDLELKELVSADLPDISFNADGSIRRRLPSRGAKERQEQERKKVEEKRSAKRKQMSSDEKNQNAPDAAAARNYESFNCARCEGTGEILLCDGPCGRAYHLHCAPSPVPEDLDNEAWYCSDCASESHHCKLCGQTGVDDLEVFRCSQTRCGQYFHKSCLEKCPGAKVSDRIYCCSHLCETCGVRGLAEGRGALCQCVRCVRAFHPKCIPPGCIRFQGNWMLCNSHEPYETTNKDDIDLQFERQCAQPLAIFGDNPAFFPREAEWIVPRFTDFRLPLTIIREADKFKGGGLIPQFKRVAVNWYNEEFVRRPTYVGEVEPCLCGSGDFCEENCVNRASYIECTKKCHHGDQCQNQRLGRRQHAKTKVIATPGRGHGLQLCEDVKAGQLMIEYCGEVISEEECNNRLDGYKVTGQKDFYMMKLDSGYVIDANLIANNARFINHSCDPNCKTELWTVGAQRRVGIFALRDLKAGTELTYDYCCEGFWKPGDEQPCLCGAENCRKFLGAKAVKKEEKATKKAKKVKKRGRKASAKGKAEETQDNQEEENDEQIASDSDK